MIRVVVAETSVIAGGVKAEAVAEDFVVVMAMIPPPAPVAVAFMDELDAALASMAWAMLATGAGPAFAVGLWRVRRRR